MQSFSSTGTSPNSLKNSIIDSDTTEIDSNMIGEADLVVFALYPHIMVEWIKANQQYFKSGVVITDVTGVKGIIVDEIQNNLRPWQTLVHLHRHHLAGAGGQIRHLATGKARTAARAPLLGLLAATGLKSLQLRQYMRQQILRDRHFSLRPPRVG